MPIRRVPDGLTGGSVLIDGWGRGRRVSASSRLCKKRDANRETRLRISIARIAYRSWERVEIGNWLMQCAVQWLTDPDLAGCSLNAGVIDYSPIEAARNLAVQSAQQRGTDLLIMVDDDTIPHRDFLKTALLATKSNPHAVVGGPARAARPGLQVNVSERGEDGVVRRVENHDAARRWGVKKVHSMGAGVLAIRMSALELLAHPYFLTEYADDVRAVAHVTEDMHFTRELTAAGGDVLCAWDCWSTHWKSEGIGKPGAEEGGVAL